MLGLSACSAASPTPTTAPTAGPAQPPARASPNPTAPTVPPTPPPASPTTTPATPTSQATPGPAPRLLGLAFNVAGKDVTLFDPAARRPLETRPLGATVSWL